MIIGPKSLALVLILAGAATGVAAAMQSVPAYDSLHVVSGHVDTVHIRRPNAAEGGDVHVHLKLVTEAGQTTDVRFRQPQSRQDALNAMSGHRVVARLDEGGELYELRLGQATLQSYLQTIEPLMADKAWTLTFAGLLASLGGIGLWLTSGDPRLRTKQRLDGSDAPAPTPA